MVRAYYEKDCDPMAFSQGPIGAGRQQCSSQGPPKSFGHTEIEAAV